MERVYAFLNENIDDKYIVVGVSGGVDSMVLLSILKEKVSSKIVCAHIHHNLRVESDEELEFVKEYCTNNDIIFEYKKLQYQSKFSEEIARDMRYEFFQELLIKYNSKTLLTAHHGDDLIETVIMKMVRGSTIKGYRGIEKISKRNKYKILRPLLYCCKDELYKYADKHNVPYREDYTNVLDNYTRNRYRKNILPFLKSENKDVHLKFLDYSDELSSYYDYVNSIVEKYYDEIVDDNKVFLLKFMKLDELIKKELLKRYLFDNYANNITKINNKHIKIILKFIEDGKVNSSINLPNGFRLIKEYDSVYLKVKEEQCDYCFEIQDKVCLPNGHIIEVVEESYDNSNFTTYIDLTGLNLPLYVRNYCLSDKILIKNMNSCKKISDIFTNEKINLSERKKWPVVVDRKGKIIWLPGLKKTKFDRKNIEKYDIILKYY